MRLRLALASLVLLTAIGLVSARPAAAVVCGVEARTNGVAADVVSDHDLNAAGDIVVFAADADPFGTNPDGNTELFVVAPEAAFQITETLGLTGSPALDASGTTLAFTSDADLTGSNGDGNVEIFVKSGIATTQLTDTTGELNEDPQISANGRYVAFTSGADLTGSNPDGTREVFRYDRNDASVDQMTDSTTSASFDVAISGDGSEVAFVSEDDLVGENPGLAGQVFVTDGFTTTQVSHGGAGGSTGGPSFAGPDGDVVFISQAPLVGTNADGGFEAYRWDSGTEAVTRLTNSTGDVEEPTVDADGSTVAFAASGIGTSGVPQVYVHEAGRVTQITRATTPNTTNTVVSDDGSTVGFLSSADLDGTNADGSSDLFLADCLRPPPCDGRAVTVLVGVNQPTSGADVIRGTAGADTVNGGAGADRFCGLNGVDRFNGGTGNDRAFGAGGDDRLIGALGDDRLDGGSGRDRLEGGDGRDALVGGTQSDTCLGGPGRDSSTSCETRTGVP